MESAPSATGINRENKFINIFYFFPRPAFPTLQPPFVPSFLPHDNHFSLAKSPTNTRPFPATKKPTEQYWMLSKTGEIRRDEACLDYAGDDVVLYPCHGSRGNQYWNFSADTHLLRHGSSDRCLAINEAKNKLIMQDCNTAVEAQRWSFQNYDASKL
ncbi:hypothetical protein ZHAS_00019272 [Anopheles sinensis]|uniref:Ricin B-type lectin domain-containing protein n=1 Tax=Anopheles sinensis TaxID=74873 RepID=A0A084WLP9_ANOSI|nr:hypothetical protein ZHAS_00019272 [Anopheles sinensis]